MTAVCLRMCSGVQYKLIYHKSPRRWVDLLNHFSIAKVTLWGHHQGKCEFFGPSVSTDIWRIKEFPQYSLLVAPCRGGDHQYWLFIDPPIFLVEQFHFLFGLWECLTCPVLHLSVSLVCYHLHPCALGKHCTKRYIWSLLWSYVWWHHHGVGS